MLKIKKGIKKKIKGKKDKEEDLFDPENLAKYKKELEESQREGSGGDGGGGSSSTLNDSPDIGLGVHEENEEWKRFKLLTAGIDVTLKKTSGDLDRIKTTSYFQKKVPVALIEVKKEQWEDVEKDTGSVQDSTFFKSHETSSSSWKRETDVVVPEVEEVFEKVVEKEVIVLDDDLFDTSYLDAIESGEFKLAYIPDSPIDELSGDDPFDTSAVADVVKKLHEEEIKEKRRVNLGSAVDFLTKKSDIFSVETTTVVPYSDKTAEINKTKRGRPVHVDLLGWDTNEEESNESTSRVTQSDVLRREVHLEKSGGGESGVDLKDLLAEFEISCAPNTLCGSTQNVISNFDLLVEPDLVEEDKDDIWFRTDSNNDVIEDQVTKEEINDDIDPFDTSVVENLGLGKRELRLLEDELFPVDETTVKETKANISPTNPTLVLLAEARHSIKTNQNIISEDDFEFNPRKDETVRSVSHPLDSVPLGSEFNAVALTPQLSNYQQEEVIDPFDTSNVSLISLPGKSELRLLEDELVTYSPGNVVTSTSDVTHFLNQGIYVESNSLLILNPLDAPDECISEILEIQHPPLTTQVTLPSSVEIDFEDPFDTSDVVDTFAPGKVELKELESELLNSTEDFVPVRVCPLRNFKILHNTSTITSSVPERQGSIHPFDSIDGDSEVEHHRPLSPYLVSTDNCFDDPFDTSAVTAILPGKIEAKLLEEELAAAASYHPKFRQTTVERTKNTFSLPPTSTPVTFGIQNFEEEEKDPFDTSIVDSLVS